jgi:hypothetical protein
MLNKVRKDKNIYNSFFLCNYRSMGNDDRIFIRTYCNRSSGLLLGVGICNMYYRILLSEDGFLRLGCKIWVIVSLLWRRGNFGWWGSFGMRAVSSYWIFWGWFQGPPRPRSAWIQWPKHEKWQRVQWAPIDQYE